MILDRAQSSTFYQLVNELLACGIGFRFQARGRSMFPAIRDGEVVYVAPVDRASLRTGDVILFRSEGVINAHRIIRRKGETFTTRGDAGVVADQELTGEQILGKVMAKECSQSGRLVPLKGMGSRMRFFAAELRRSLAIGKKLERLLAN